MELIYMYIKKMHNGAIKNQEINFSRKYNVQLKNNKLRIKQNLDTLFQYYGENIINITALVGKNGSGKTSILDALGLSYQDRINMKEDSFFMIYAYNNDYFLEIYHQSSVEGIINLQIQKDIRHNIVGLYMHLESNKLVLSPLGEDKNGYRIKDNFPLRYHYNILNYKSPRINQESNYLDSKERGFLLEREYIKQVSLAEKYSIITEMNKLELGQENVGNVMKDVQISIHLKDEHNILNEKKPLESHNSIGFLAYRDFITSLKDYCGRDDISQLTMIKIKHEIDPKVIDLLNIYDTAMMHNESDHYMKDYVSIDIDYLSEGLTNVLDCLSGLATLYIHQTDEAVLLIDEPDRAMHPELARRFISILINQLKSLEGIRLQIIMSTHSPFVISDLLPESVYYVEKDNIRNAENTLAENIHTLLYDKFFMSYTIGELARTNIENMYAILKSDLKLSESQIKYYQHLIKRIGNDVLRDSLEKLLTKKLPSEVERLEMEIKALNELLEKKKSTLGGLVNDQD